VSACLVLAQLAVPLHLSLEDHVWSSASGEHVHVHAVASHDDGHGHGHAHAHANDPLQREAPDGDHDPHPVEDHVEPAAELAAPPQLVIVALAPAPADAWLSGLEPAALEALENDARVPRPPPERAAAAPRAPPAVV
jgi:hypothetical protein